MFNFNFILFYLVIFRCLLLKHHRQTSFPLLDISSKSTPRFVHPTDFVIPLPRSVHSPDVVIPSPRLVVTPNIVT
jgi:hypothetical protein